MSQVQKSQTPNALERLLKRIKIAEEIVNILMESDNKKISEILQLAVPHELLFENLFKTRNTLPVDDIYEKFFRGWEYDECVHYLLVKLAEDKYALIYSCSELFKEKRIRFSIAINGKPIE